MKFELFSISGTKDFAFFAVEHGADEYELYENALSKLKEQPGIVLGEEIMGPSEEVTPGSYFGTGFHVIYDLDYGASLQCGSTDGLRKLIGILEA